MMMKKYNTPELRMSMFMNESVKTSGTYNPLSETDASYNKVMSDAGTDAKTINLDAMTWTF